MEKEERQEVFLAAIVEWGTIRKACEVTGVSRRGYRKWMTEDVGFSERIDGAKTDFGEGLEEIALDRIKNPDKGKGSDILLIGLLNANLPHKYRPAQAMDTDAAKELITEWRKAAQQAKSEPKPAEGELSAPIERTLFEILEKRGSSRKDGGVGDQEET